MIDRHHVLHYAKEWRLRPEARDIREHPSLIPALPREVHNSIHEHCPPVPLLGYHALKRVGRLWVPNRDTLQSVDNLLFAIEEAHDDPRCHGIEKSLGFLSMQAIELQRPFLKEGL